MPLATDTPTTASGRVSVPYPYPPNYTDLFPYQKVGVDWLRSRKRALLADEMGLGKAIALESLVLSPSGFIRMGDIRIGQPVIDPDGGIAEVTGVYPQGALDAYRVTAADGGSVICSLDHLWLLQTAQQRFRGHPGCVMPLS